MNYLMSPKDFEEKAELLKALAHPIRLCIIKSLIKNSSANVSQICNCLKTPQSTISQHLIKLKNTGIVEGERNKNEIIYRIKDKRITDIIKVLFDF
ncbi:MAG: ArsR/SmtB family transcription factor [Fusobacteriaceae bacterium]